MKKTPKDPVLRGIRLVEEAHAEHMAQYEARMKADQLDFLAKRNALCIDDEPLMASLRAKLLSIGGDEVCLRNEPDLRQLLAKGRGWPTDGLVEMPGEKCHCHSNSARLAIELGYSVVTGWALGPGDAIWRQHTFCWDGKRIVETAGVRSTYWGVKLTKAQGRTFALMNPY